MNQQQKPTQDQLKIIYRASNKENIESVYSGYPGCGCGCRGNYSENKGSITKVWKKYVSLSGDVQLFTDTNWVSWDVDGRRYAIYLKPL